MADFLDTNVVVYAFDDDEPVKQARARQLMRERPDAVISTQVLLEWYAVVTRKFAPAMPLHAAAGALASLAALHVVDADAELVVRAAELAAQHQMSIWDAIIVEAASLASCETLLSEDLTDGASLRGVSIHNPFAG
ncbi:hypothetical protein BJF86_05400 [Serinicoccus sp. CNJ-927]|uniref:PIN domain-containing protein n=1 Tax=Serinicoccus sp. CNJ-927 TaxID=1904970 RepID=UPI000963FE01|nr:PIN domain-containing protein [Serinicoccus sp. CNJ-927]OLT40235.1 hypothetical protein BJF86_05400 [Serinicoccus sp. CNJ-927]